MSERDEFDDVLSRRFAGAFAGATKAKDKPYAAPATPSSPASGFGAVDREARKKRERKTTRTAAQRERRAATRTKLVNFRTSTEFHALLAQLAADAGLTMTDIIEDGIELLADKAAKQRGEDVQAIIARGLATLEKKPRRSKRGRGND